MSTFEDDRYQWVETYFVLLDPTKRPKADAVKKGIGSIFSVTWVRKLEVDPEGKFVSLSIVSETDNAAVDIIYQAGEQVVYEIEALAEELAQLTPTKRNRNKIEKAKQCSAKLEVLHFEKILEPIESPKKQFSSELGNNESAFGTITDFSKFDPFASRKHFKFDPDNYIAESDSPNLPKDFGFDEKFNDYAGFNKHIEIDDCVDNSERLDPNTLIQTLELLCSLTDGVAIDPASGAVL
ncbi:MAG: hypothetical protein ACRC2T_10715 [Thermoguttaceae bacterium]